MKKYIIDLKTIPPQHEKTVRDLWAGRDKISLTELKGLTLSVNAIVPANGDLKLPFKDQIINVQTGYVNNSSGEQVLVGVAFVIPSVIRGNNFSLML